MRDYRKLAPLLDDLVRAQDASMYYDVFADALVWSDELPPAEDRVKCGLIGSDLRGVWRYRTTVILGEPKDKFRAAWEEAMEYFPNWPGFDLARRDAALAKTFLRMQKEAMNKWEYDEDCIEAELARKNVNV